MHLLEETDDSLIVACCCNPLLRQGHRDTVHVFGQDSSQQMEVRNPSLDQHHRNLCRLVNVRRLIQLPQMDEVPTFLANLAVPAREADAVARRVVLDGLHVDRDRELLRLRLHSACAPLLLDLSNRHGFHCVPFGHEVVQMPEVLGFLWDERCRAIAVLIEAFLQKFHGACERAGATTVGAPGLREGPLLLVTDPWPACDANGLSDS
mmetsp:Transcript_70196/g.217704  ORF Transcript_70196/g.217704 Transcript_70196/m.217704 type:complete len:207 (+) Transcript_70196:765-1385(+)